MKNTRVETFENALAWLVATSSFSKSCVFRGQEAKTGGKKMVSAFSNKKGYMYMWTGKNYSKPRDSCERRNFYYYLFVVVFSNEGGLV